MPRKVINLESQVRLVRARATMFQEAIDRDDEAKNDYLKDLRTEFMSVYNADPAFTLLNAESIRVMLRVNLRYRFVPLHQFGIHIEL